MVAPFLGFTFSAYGTCWLLKVPINSIEGLQQISHQSGWSSKNSSNSAKVPQKRAGWHTLLFRKLRHPLKIDGWKLKFPLQMVPFLETFVHFRRVIRVSFWFEKKTSSKQKHPNKWDKKTEVHPWDNPFSVHPPLGALQRFGLQESLGENGYLFWGPWKWQRTPFRPSKKNTAPPLFGCRFSSFASWTGEFSS